MKEHHEELLQSIAEISHHYNQLLQLLEIKQATVLDETKKMVADVNHRFNSRVNELREAQKKMIADIETTQHKAQVEHRRVSCTISLLNIRLSRLVSPLSIRRCELSA